MPALSTTQDTTVENIYHELADIFDLSQNGPASHAKLVKKCQNLYKRTEFNEFFDSFTKNMQHIMINMQKNTHADRVVDFISKFCSSLSVRTTDPAADKTVVEKVHETRNKKSQDDTHNSTLEMDTTLDAENTFLTTLIDFLIKSNKANSDAVRYRTCQILSKVMASINNDQFIDEDLYDQLCDSLLERLKDINSRVQVQAVAAIYRLQDPNDRECRVIKALLFLMTYDPHWQVRYQALSHVAFSKLSLSEIIDRVRDPNVNVRRKALLILSEKVLVKFISIEKRLLILNYSLKDDDSSVVETCCKKLLPSWLAFKENDVCKLLKALDVVDATETCELMMDKMHEDHSLDSLCNDFAHLLNENHIIPEDKLDAESVFYWSWICKRCKKEATQNPKKKVIKKNAVVSDKNVDVDVDAEEGEPEAKEQNSKIGLLAIEDQADNLENGDDQDRTLRQIESEDSLDRLLPSLTEFCDYVKLVIKKIDYERDEKASDERLQIENSFTLRQLITMFDYIDYSDVHGKKILINLCHELFSNKNYTFLFDSLIKIYKAIVPNLQQRINNLVELISDIRDPPSPTQNVPEPPIQSPEAAPDSDDKLNKHQMLLKISELKFKKMRLKDEFDNLYKDIKNVDKEIDMNMLSELREEIKKCDIEISTLTAELNGSNSNSESLSKQPSESATINGSESESQTNSEQFDPIECAYHCLKLSLCLLEDPELKTINPQLRSLCDTLIVENISCVNEEIRALAVRALNLICILKLEVAQKYMPLFVKIVQSDKKEVMLEGYKAIINCIMAYSIPKLISNNSGLDTSVDQSSNYAEEATAKILSVLTSLLDNEDSDVYTAAVEGFCKLYMTGHILSAKLFSKLIIMYYSPLMENDVRLKACLSAFLPQFSFFRSINQVCVEESFMITLKCLINAPVDSYLCEIDLIKVVEILFHLTNPKNLMQRGSKKFASQSVNICHENIVKSICYEALKDDNTYKYKTYLKILPLADLSGADYVSLKEIHQLATDIEEHIDDKLVKKTATKYSETVKALMIKKPEYQQEQESKEKETNEATTIASQTLETDQTQQSDSESKRIDKDNRRSSSEIIDFQFPTLIKKVGNKIKRTDSTQSQIPNESILKAATKSKSSNETTNETINQSTNETNLDVSSSNRRKSLRLGDKQVAITKSATKPKEKATKSSIKITKLDKPNIKLKELSVVVSKLDEETLNRSNISAIHKSSLPGGSQSFSVSKLNRSKSLDCSLISKLNDTVNKANESSEEEDSSDEGEISPPTNKTASPKKTKENLIKKKIIDNEQDSSEDHEKDGTETEEEQLSAKRNKQKGKVSPKKKSNIRKKQNDTSQSATDQNEEDEEREDEEEKPRRATRNSKTKNSPTKVSKSKKKQSETSRSTLESEEDEEEEASVIKATRTSKKRNSSPTKRSSRQKQQPNSTQSTQESSDDDNDKENETVIDRKSKKSKRSLSKESSEESHPRPRQSNSKTPARAKKQTHKSISALKASNQRSKSASTNSAESIDSEEPPIKVARNSVNTPRSIRIRDKNTGLEDSVITRSSSRLNTRQSKTDNVTQSAQKARNDKTETDSPSTRNRPDRQARSASTNKNPKRSTRAK